MATIKRFARQAGFSSTVAGQLTFLRRKSTRMNYQARWSTYGMWCAEICLRSSSLSISEIAEFLTYLFKRKGTALSTVKGYRAMLSAVFRFPFRGSLPLISLTTSFGLLRFLLPGLFFLPPPWDLDEVLKYLLDPSFEPLANYHFWTSPRRPCPSGYGYGQTGFGTPSPVILCVIPG